MRIWFNHWFSTAYYIIGLMKEGRDDCVIIGSSRNPDSVIKLACDEWYSEPDNISDEEYIDFCLDFCKRHSIDVFVPRRCMALIGANSGKFQAHGIRLLTDTDNEAVSILQNKTAAYRYLSDVIPENIPMYFEVNSSEEFLTAYEKITAEYDRACFKLAADEGATSFRVIDNSMRGAMGLYRAPGLKISIESAMEIMNEYDFKSPILAMPYLCDTEVSCDCLALPTGNVIIPRYKSNGRVYTIKCEERIMNACERILQKTGLSMPCNIQFKFHGETPYLLEINTRMSGGVQLSCAGTGINIPKLALKKLLGETAEAEWDKKECKVSYVEYPLKIT